MAGTVAASPKVASTVGLKDVVIAELTEDTEATLTYAVLPFPAWIEMIWVVAMTFPLFKSVRRM